MDKIMKVSCFVLTIIQLFLWASLGYCLPHRDMAREAAYSPEEKTIIEKVKNYVTSSGQTIEKIINAGENKQLAEMEKGSADYGEPWWEIRASWLGPGYDIRCLRSATYYYESGQHADGAIVRDWYYDGARIFSIGPSDIDDQMPVWEPKEKQSR